MRHKSLEDKLWRDAFIEALEQEKDELISERKMVQEENSVNRPGQQKGIETTSQKIKKVKDELKRVEEQDKTHSYMFRTLQESALKKARENVVKEKIAASSRRQDIDDTKKQLAEQRQKYKEVIKDIVISSYFSARKPS